MFCSSLRIIGIGVPLSCPLARRTEAYAAYGRASGPTIRSGWSPIEGMDENRLNSACRADPARNRSADARARTHAADGAHRRADVAGLRRSAARTHQRGL